MPFLLKGASRNPSLDETKALIDAAIANAQDPDVAVKNIDAACQGSKPSFIRHLTVDEVVHDEPF